MRVSALFTRITDTIEHTETLDGLAARLNSVITKVVRPGPVEDVLSGTPLGHPLHPALVAVPVGAWVGSLALDAAGQDDAARTMIGVGLVSALPAAASGASDWASLHDAEQRIGLVHALLNYAGIGAFAASWLVRGRDRRATGRVLSAAGTALVGAAGFLGGHLSYVQGVGVDTTAFSPFPADWTAVDGLDTLPGEDELVAGRAAGIPVLLTRRSGRLVALADRCTHRGAPLHEGEVRAGCVRCPWHDSAFSLDDGAVLSGPATRPQPRFEVREHDGAVQVRRAEDRALRSNAVGR